MRLTREQELWIVSQLVLGVEPNATEERIRANYEELLRNRKETVDQESDEFLSQFGSAHGGWPLSASDKEDIDKLLKRSPTTSPLPPLINSTTSSILTVPELGFGCQRGHKWSSSQEEEKGD